MRNSGRKYIIRLIAIMLVGVFAVGMADGAPRQNNRKKAKTTQTTGNKKSGKPGKSTVRTSGKSGKSTGETGTRSAQSVRQERNRTSREIETTRRDIRANLAQTKKKVNALRSIEADIAISQRSIDTINSAIDTLNLRLSSLEDTITATEANLALERERYGESLRKARTMRQGLNPLTFVFSSKTFAESWRRMRFLREAGKSRISRARKLKKVTDTLKVRRDRYKTVATQREAKAGELVRKQAQLTSQKQKTEALVADLKTRGGELNSILKEKQDRMRQLDNELDRIIAEETRKAREAERLAAEERRKEQARQAEAERQRLVAEQRRQQDEKNKAGASAKDKKSGKNKDKKNEAEKSGTHGAGNSDKLQASGGQPTNAQTAKASGAQTATAHNSKAPEPSASVAPRAVANPITAVADENRRLTGGFEQNKGRLLFPVYGSYKIVGNFGRNPHAELRHVEVNNNGIDIEVRPGTNARAVFDGEVSAAFRLGGYENVVMIRHGNYLTVYAGLSQLMVRKGQKIKAGEPVGRIVSDPDDGNRTVLHFEIRKERQKLNPLEWVR